MIFSTKKINGNIVKQEHLNCFNWGNGIEIMRKVIHIIIVFNHNLIKLNLLSE